MLHIVSRWNEHIYKLKKENNSQKKLFLGLQVKGAGIDSTINRYSNTLQTSLELFLELFYKVIHLKQWNMRTLKRSKPVKYLIQSQITGQTVPIVQTDYRRYICKKKQPPKHMTSAWPNVWAHHSGNKGAHCLNPKWHSPGIQISLKIHLDPCKSVTTFSVHNLSSEGTAWLRAQRQHE